MAIKFDITKWGVAFPSKTLGSEHELNMIIKEDTSNGTIVGVGDYKSFDNYEVAACPATYKAKVLEKAADGWGWYVQVTAQDTNNPAVLLYTPEVIAETYDHRFTDLANFYNKKGDVVRGKVLKVLDWYEISEDLFDTTAGPIKEGAELTISGQKHVIKGE